MRIAAVFIIGLSLTAFGVIVFAEFQNKARTPMLTTEDVARRTTPGTNSEPSASPQPDSIQPVYGSISWHRELSRAKSEAQTGNNVIVVDVYTDWCGWCKKMDSDIYTDPRVVGLSRREVFVKLDAEDGGEGQRFAREMRVTGYPTTIILDSNGNKLSEAKGYIRSPEAFIRFVKTARGLKRSA
jgi:thiol:disulfide interchange protein